MRLELCTDNCPGTSAIYTWLLNHNSGKNCPEWQFKLAFQSTSSTISLECLICGRELTVCMPSHGVIIETLEEILKLPGVYCQLQIDRAGLETKSEQPESY